MSMSRIFLVEDHFFSVRKFIRLLILPNNSPVPLLILVPFEGEPNRFYVRPRPLPHPRIRIHVNPIRPISICRFPSPSTFLLSPYSAPIAPTNPTRLAIIRTFFLPRSENHELEQDDHEGEERQPDYSYDQDDRRIEDRELVDPWFGAVFVRAVCG